MARPIRFTALPSLVFGMAFGLPNLIYRVPTSFPLCGESRLWAEYGLSLFGTPF